MSSRDSVYPAIDAWSIEIATHTPDEELAKISIQIPIVERTGKNGGEEKVNSPKLTAYLFAEE